MENNNQFEAVPVNDDIQRRPSESAEVWRSCCMKVNKQMVVYMTTMGILGGIIIFCCYQLTHLTSCSDQATYISLLSATVGLIVPSPMMRHINQDS